MKSSVRFVAVLACMLAAFQIALAEPESHSRYDYNEQTTERVTDKPDKHAEGGNITVPKITDKIGRGLRRIGGTLQHFFTGRRTIDQGDR